MWCHPVWAPAHPTHDPGTCWVPASLLYLQWPHFARDGHAPPHYSCKLTADLRCRCGKGEQIRRDVSAADSRLSGRARGSERERGKSPRQAI